MVSEMPLLGFVNEEDPEPLQTIYLWLYLDVGPAIGKDVAASQVPSVAAAAGFLSSRCHLRFGRPWKTLVALGLEVQTLLLQAW